MKKIVTLTLLVLLPLIMKAQQNCAPDSCLQVMIKSYISTNIDSIRKQMDSLNAIRFKKNDSTWMAACIVYPTRANGVNTWHMSDNNGHDLLNMKDSIVASGWDLSIFFKKSANTVLTALFSPDALQGAKSPMGSAQFRVLGGYLIGASVYREYARINISKLKPIQATIEWDSVNNRYSIVQWPDNPFSLAGSKPISITHNSDRFGNLYLDIRTDSSFKMPKIPTIQPTAFDADPKYDFSYTIIPDHPFHVIVYPKDNTNQRIKRSTPPNHMQFVFDCGYTFGPVDVTLEDFGSTSNFFFQAILK